MTRCWTPIAIVALPLLGSCEPLLGDDDDDMTASDDDTGSTGDTDSPGDDDTSDLEGCGDGVEQALAAITTWTVVACGDIHVAAANADQTVSLSLNVFVDADDYQVGDVFETEPLWPAGFLWLETGEDLLGYDCTDVLTVEVIDRRWEAMFGTVRVTMLEVESGTDEVQVELHDVLVVDPDDWTSGCEIPDVTWPDLTVGWLAGGG